MNLVFKNTNEAGDPTKPYLFKDKRVNEGSLYFIEFSNKGALNGYDLKKGITDLADDVPLRAENGITTLPQIAISATAEMPELTEKRGMPMTFLGNYDQNRSNTGIIIQGVGEYLYEKQPRALMLAWVSSDYEAYEGQALSGGQYIRQYAQTGGGGNLDRNLSFHIPGGTAGAGQTNNVSVNLSTKSGLLNYTLPAGVPTQIALEYVSAIDPVRIFVNGNFYGYGAQAEGSFGQPVDGGSVNIGGIANNSTYRMATDVYVNALYDLAFTGMTADEIVAMDYEYVNGIGQFEGKPTRRPYANIAQ